MGVSLAVGHFLLFSKATKALLRGEIMRFRYTNLALLLIALVAALALFPAAVLLVRAVQHINHTTATTVVDDEVK